MDLSSTTVRSTFIKTLMVSSSRLRSLPLAIGPGTCTYSPLLQALVINYAAVAVLPPPKSKCPWVLLSYVPYLLFPWIHPYASPSPLLARCSAAACAPTAGPPCALIACPVHAPPLTPLAADPRASAPLYLPALLHHSTLTPSFAEAGGFGGELWMRWGRAGRSLPALISCGLR